MHGSAPPEFPAMADLLSSRRPHLRRGELWHPADSHRKLVRPV